MEITVVEITVKDMRAAGKPGYVAKIVGSEKRFLNPKSRSGYGVSANDKTFEISEEGIYELCDANFGSTRRKVEFFKFENGKIVATADSLAELLTADLELPDLEGSAKQVSWAGDIRSRFLAKLKVAGEDIPEWVADRTSAKWWIDNYASKK